MAPPENYYSDGTITVTRTEIRTANHTLFLDKVSSVDVRSSNFVAVALIPLLATAVPCAFLAVLFRGFMFKVFLIPLLPLLLFWLVASFVRSTRVTLHTTGGNVILAWKIGFGDHLAELTQYRKLKAAIETAKSGNAPSPP